MLPIEICEAIIEYCQDDTPSLLSCALVCKAWVPKSRQLLFNRRNVCLWAGNTEAFCDLSHTLKFHIAAIDLDGYTFIRPNSDHYDPDGLVRLSQAVINECTNLRSLKMYDAESVFPLFAQSPITSTLTTLRLMGDLIGNRNLSVQAGTILDLVGRCTVLKNLSMCYETPGRHNQDVVEPNDGPGSKKSTLRFLRTLYLDLPWSVFIPWFLIPGVLRFPSIERLQITQTSSDPHSLIPLLQTHLETFSSSLKDLIIRLEWDKLTVLNLSRFKALRSIMFQVGYVRPGEKISPRHWLKLRDIVRSRGEGESESLMVIVNVPKEYMDAPDIEGVTWILDEQYAQNYYRYE
ncbi:hypothetical protein V5O48_005684 [Marasmius crinis-equi]|uniref:F-box domain-containing protein n=1 Tax=Marasmius crinis-equi TaxID=585013 RepID=A0ABR3FLN2_9AGAR